MRERGVTSVNPIVALVALCVVFGALLGVVHEVTEPVAVARAEQQAQETYSLLMSEASSFEEVPCDIEGCEAALRAVGQGGATVGFVVVAQSKGYGGEVPLAVAFGVDGVVQGVMPLPNEETPGLGTRISEESYIGQYAGLPARSLDAGEVDLISGATISSEAALMAFNIAVAVYGEVS